MGKKIELIFKMKFIYLFCVNEFYDIVLFLGYSKLCYF